MLEFEYFEKFKELGKNIAYSDMVNTIVELKDKYIEEACQGIRSWSKTTHILDALGIVEGVAIIRGREALKKC